MRLLTCIVALIALVPAQAQQRIPARDLVTLEMITGARDGCADAAVDMTTGFVVSSHARVCLDLVPGPLGLPLGISKVLMHGYLADE